jgi:hypothetical protein
MELTNLPEPQKGYFSGKLHTQSTRDTIQCEILSKNIPYAHLFIYAIVEYHFIF